MATVKAPKTKVLTPFEQARADKAAGLINTPSVSIGSKPIDYFGYQLSVHKFNLSIMAAGMTCRGITITQLKKYYGLKGNAKACAEQFETILRTYKNEMNATTLN